MTSTNPVVIEPYNECWPLWFKVIRARILPVLGTIAVAIEHVGSTAVPGLAAKPIIDIDVLLRARTDLPMAIARLASMGYAHRGDLGIAGREAFRAPTDGFRQHLYVCQPGNSPYREHLVFRDYLRAYPEALHAYAALKRQLAEQFRDDRLAYNDAKASFVAEILKAASGACVKL